MDSHTESGMEGAGAASASEGGWSLLRRQKECRMGGGEAARQRVSTPKTTP